MTHDAFRTSLNALQIRPPFRPHVVHFTEGGSIVVRHREALRYQSVGTGVCVGKAGEMILFDEVGASKITSVCKVVAT